MADLGIAAHARSLPSKTAIVDGERRVTYGELHAGACRAANALRRLGLGPEDRVAIALHNSPEFFVVSAGAAMLGAEVVPVSWRAQSDEVRYLVEDSGAKVLIAETTSDAPAKVVPPEELSQGPATIPEGALDPAPLFYRAYTSGTPGRPK